MIVSSIVIVIVVWFALFLQRLYEKCTLDAVLGRGVGGHITNGIEYRHVHIPINDITRG